MEGRATALIQNTGTNDVLDLMVWGVTLAVILAVLGFALGYFTFRSKR